MVQKESGNLTIFSIFLRYFIPRMCLCRPSEAMPTVLYHSREHPTHILELSFAWGSVGIEPVTTALQSAVVPLNHYTSSGAWKYERIILHNFLGSTECIQMILQNVCWNTGTTRSTFLHCTIYTVLLKEPILLIDSPNECQKTERWMTEHRMTEHQMTERQMTECRMTERQMTERRMTKCRKRPNVEWLNAEWTEHWKWHEFLHIFFIYSKHCLEL